MIENFVDIDMDTGSIVIKRNLIVAYGCFNELLRRDKGKVIKLPGDYDGRLKMLFLKELGYIWIIGNPNSYPYRNGFSAKEADKYARKVVKMPPEWEADELIQECITTYSDELMTAQRKLAHSLSRGIANWEKIVDKCTSQIEKLLEIDELTVKQIEEISELNKQILNMADVAPKQIEMLNKVIAGLNEASDVVKRGRGDTVIMDSQNPDTAIG